MFRLRKKEKKKEAPQNTQQKLGFSSYLKAVNARAYTYHPVVFSLVTFGWARSSITHVVTTTVVILKDVNHVPTGLCIKTDTSSACASSYYVLLKSRVVLTSDTGGASSSSYLGSLLEFYILTTSKVPTCDTMHSWWLYSATPVENRAASTEYIYDGWMGSTKEFIYQDVKVRLFEAHPACNQKLRPPYWTCDNEQWKRQQHDLTIYVS